MRKGIIKRAFTLAEVLLVVVIIGIVAALAVPNLNKNINEEKYISLLKGTMSQVNSAIGAVIAQYGSIENASSIDCATGTTSGNTTCFAAKIADKMNVGLNCATSVSNCFNSSTTTVINSAVSLSCGYAFTLSNGVSVCFNATAIGNNYLVHFDLDGVENGFNTLGIDKFTLRYTNDGLMFVNGDSRTYNSSFSVSDDEAAWAFYVGNMDYTKCSGSLKWQTKETCD